MKATAAREVSFVELCIEERRAKLSDHFPYKIKECVDWEWLRKTIRKGYKKNKNATGNPAYDPIVLFKILLLEKWYKLSDYQAEERINDSFLFSDFIDIALSAPAPDHSTICRFRNELTKLNRLTNSILGAEGQKCSFVLHLSNYCDQKELHQWIGNALKLE